MVGEGERGRLEVEYVSDKGVQGSKEPRIHLKDGREEFRSGEQRKYDLRKLGYEDYLRTVGI